MGCRFLVQTTKIGKTPFPFKTALSEVMLRQIEWRLQSGPITKGGVLLVTNLFFWKICSSFGTS